MRRATSSSTLTPSADGKTLSFKTRYHNGGHGWVPTIARYEVEYDSVKDACERACQQKVYQYHLDMEILEAELQWYVQPLSLQHLLISLY
jgi:hypothetical protein